VYSTRFIDPAWGFAMGWNYAMGWLVVLPLELTAAGITIQYWNSTLNVGIFITIFLVLIVCINLAGVRGYGEAEFVFSIIKVVAVVGFIITGIVIDAGGGPNHDVLGSQYWYDPGAFANGFKGVCSVFVTAAFSFAGTELVGLAAAECENPRKTLPRATKQVFWRITLFYMISLSIVGCLVPYNNPQLLNGTSSVDVKASPFVIAIQNAGINVLPSIMNVVILISVLSVGNSSTYGSTRTITALAEIGQAPRIFDYIDKKGRPMITLTIALALGCLAYINIAPVGATVFNWLLALSGLSSFFTW
jgi:yeast amino acid transporter